MKTGSLSVLFSTDCFCMIIQQGMYATIFIDEQLNNKLKIVNIYAAAILNEYLFAIGTTKSGGYLILNRSGELGSAD